MCPDYFQIPGLFPNHFQIPWLFHVFQVGGHPEDLTSLPKRNRSYRRHFFDQSVAKTKPLNQEEISKKHQNVRLHTYTSYMTKIMPVSAY